MLTAVAVIFALGACVVVGHWFITRVDELGRVADFPALWVSLLIILAMIAAVPGVMRGRLEDRLSRVASTVAGKQVRVRCQALGGAFVDAGAEYGYVKYRADGTPVNWTLIKRDQCNDLSGYLKSNKRNPSFDRMVAVHILTHEAMHLAGITNEPGAECAAMQRDAQTAQLLGATPDDALALAVTYFETVYPRMPDDYRSGECKPGGSMDENIIDAPWAVASGVAAG